MHFIQSGLIVGGSLLKLASYITRDEVPIPVSPVLATALHGSSRSHIEWVLAVQNLEVRPEVFMLWWCVLETS